MGSGIAQLFAQCGLPVTLFDVNQTVLEKASQSIRNQLLLFSAKGKIKTDDVERIAGSIQYTNRISDCKGDLVIEAIIEKTEAKTLLFQQLSEVNEGSPCIFASNTSSLSLSTIAQAVKDRSTFAGMHFFNPAPSMKLVEIVKTADTDERVITVLMNLCTRIGKTAVLCNDVPGFIVNRVARPYYLEALHLAEQYNIPFQIIDGMMEASGFRMGPFRLMDFIGNDINYTVSVSIYDALEKPARLKPSELQEEKVKRGALGIKTGSGYYDYESDHR
jgi:3-hydroxybutyryl-CoA dehydrogenase